MQQVYLIMNSPLWQTIKTAGASGVETDIALEGGVINVNPDYRGSGMTLGLGGNSEDLPGFVLGKQAFSNDEELTKTLLHELWRLETTSAAGGVADELVSEETAGAYSFADQAYSTISGIK